MEIKRLSLIEGAKRATGLAVVIDVFRAFTTAAYVMANGAERIIPVGSVEQAFGLRRLHPDWVLIGERRGIRVEGFDYGNSPYEVSLADFSGRTVVQSTGAGTQGVVNAAGAEAVVLGSFVMAGAVASYIESRQPEIVSLVAMGDVGVKPNAEDEGCADYIEGCLRGRPPDFEEIRGRIRDAPSGAKFFDPSQPQFREEDFRLALELDRFDFVLGVSREGGLLKVERLT
ncbi:MAG: 2-phosphosulfolactate phosphatase [Candidatus Bathyarchaeota archaeon]|nr:2-phosphosulfolactate phosphatase [Candidatus Bathyarchaeota archaeon]